MNQIFNAIGLMSGTSMDGIDVALIRSDGGQALEHVSFYHMSYNDEFREKLRTVLGRSDRDHGDIKEVERLSTQQHIDAVKEFMVREGLSASDIDVIGYHGQTIFHDPDNGVTVQLGDGKTMSQALGIDVVYDFRTNDVSQGGQGAPLAPVYHTALCADLQKPIVVLNIGGVGNVTWIGKNQDDLIAFDTGPGNALVDDWVREKTGEAFDDGGRYAEAGKIDQTILDKLLSHDYFDASPPKSLDRDAFDGAPIKNLSLKDGAATLTAFTVETIIEAQKFFPQQPQEWIVCGGGRHNKTIMAMLSERLGVSVISSDTIGWNGDAVEAECFAYLAIRHLKDLPLSYPNTTGVKTPITGGVLSKK